MIELLSREDAPAAGLVLARAFRDNPGMLAVMKGDPPEVRLDLLRGAMTGFAEGVRRYGTAEVLKQDGRVVAVSLSFAPGAYPPPFWFQVITAPGPLRGGPRRVWRFLQVDSWMRRMHPSYAHWYLWILGVDPDHQGKGHGGSLLRSLSARAAGDRVACYLETDKLSSVRLYEKHGYAVTSEETLAAMELKLWFMRRPEQA